MSTEHMLSISEAQREMTRIPDQLTGDLQSITVTRYGKPVLSILPYHVHKDLLEDLQVSREQITLLQAKIESLQETLEVLQDDDLMEAIRQGIQEIAENKGESLDDVLKELGWE